MFGGNNLQLAATALKLPSKQKVVMHLKFKFTFQSICVEYSLKLMVWWKKVFQCVILSVRFLTAKLEGVNRTEKKMVSILCIYVCPISDA